MSQISATENPTPPLTTENLEASVLPSFDKLLFALSSISHICGHAPTKSTGAAQQRKHLSLLDGIALLLVTEDKADVAAVSFLQTSTSIEFYYAKNRPCAPRIRGYIESLLEVLRSYEPSKREECIM